jgi:hypothetical protein
MSTSLRSAAILLLVLVTVLPAAQAADSDWKLPNLNPFASKSQPTRPRTAQPPTSGWHMPKLLPSTAASKSKSNQPNTWNKMTTGTQQFFSKTADALTPWDNNKPAAAPKAITGSNTAFTHNNAAKAEPKSGSILPASWWSSEPKAKGQSPKSVNEFLSSPRP